MHESRKKLTSGSNKYSTYSGELKQLGGHSFQEQGCFVIPDMLRTINLVNYDIGEKLSEFGGRLDYPSLTKDLAKEIETLWEDAAIQETYSRGHELQVPDCTKYFVENLRWLSYANYVPTEAMTGESILSKCQKARKSLEKSLVQIQDMVPVMLAVEMDDVKCHEGCTSGDNNDNKIMVKPINFQRLLLKKHKVRSWVNSLRL